MPKLNPNRRIIERHYRVPVRDLFLSSSGLPDTPTEHVIGPVRLKVWTTSDQNGWIEVGTKRWRVHYYPRHNWRNGYDEYCAVYMIDGANGKRHRHLLVGEDGTCGTQSELDAHWQSSHIYSPNRIIKKRTKILGELGVDMDANNFDLRYVPLEQKPKGMYWKHWAKQEQLRLGSGYVLVKRPEGMKTVMFRRSLAYLNRHHKPRDTGKQAMEDLDRIFGS